jgi:hypothetical protein
MPNIFEHNDRMGGDQPVGRDEREPGRNEARTGEDQPRKKQRRGFAAMDPAKQKEIASKGGKASHEQGTGHEWTSASAREAGRKGGLASHGGRGKRVGPPTSGTGGSGGTMTGGSGGTMGGGNLGGESMGGG